MPQPCSAQPLVLLSQGCSWCPASVWGSGIRPGCQLCPAAPRHPTPQGDVSYGCTPLSASSLTSSSRWVFFKKCEVKLGISFYQKGQHKAHLGILFHLLHAETSPCRMKKLFILWGWSQSLFAHLYKICQCLISGPPTQTIPPCIFYFSDL